MGNSPALASTAYTLFDNFLTGQVPTILAHIDNQTELHFFHCDFSDQRHLSRRLLIVADADSEFIVVCTEIEYAMFEGDAHYKVERAGMLTRDQLHQELVPLLQKAFTHLMDWQPSCDDILDSLY